VHTWMKAYKRAEQIKMSEEMNTEWQQQMQSNEQRAMSNEQWAASNEQWTTKPQKQSNSKHRGMERTPDVHACH
jgi:hypothetical protein